MINIYAYTTHDEITKGRIAEIAGFLHKHLDAFGDELPAIEKAIAYARGESGKPGGLVLTATDETASILGAAVVNITGMAGYIPENILVYIATRRDQRGKGIGKKLMQAIIDNTDGDIALHCEPNNPALKLYESLGFQNKYLEMRLKK